MRTVPHGCTRAPRCAAGERAGADTVTNMTWALWLAVPIGATALAAIWVWWRGYRVRRAGRPLGTEAAVRAHSRYLDALTIPARSAARPERPDPPDTLPG